MNLQNEDDKRQPATAPHTPLLVSTHASPPYDVRHAIINSCTFYENVAILSRVRETERETVKGRYLILLQRVDGSTEQTVN